MDIDTDRWRRLLDDYRDAREDGPNFVDVQTAIERKQRAPAALDSFKAAGVQGHASGPPMGSARGRAEILPGVGGYDQAGVQRVHDSSLREYEARVAEAVREQKRVEDRLHRASAAGYNFRGILAWLRILLRLILCALIAALPRQTVPNPAS